jgi:hypothetical protein
LGDAIKARDLWNKLTDLEKAASGNHVGHLVVQVNAAANGGTAQGSEGGL